MLVYIRRLARRELPTRDRPCSCRTRLMRPYGGVESGSPITVRFPPPLGPPSARPLMKFHRRRRRSDPGACPALPRLLRFFRRPVRRRGGGPDSVGIARPGRRCNSCPTACRRLQPAQRPSASSPTEYVYASWFSGNRTIRPEPVWAAAPARRKKHQRSRQPARARSRRPVGLNQRSSFVARRHLQPASALISGVNSPTRSFFGTP